MDLAKVWPLEPGVDGVLLTDYSKVKLKTGQPGFMELGAAKDAEKAGRVQLMAGIGFNDLEEPRTEAVKKPVAEAPKTEPVQEVKADIKADIKADYRTAELKPEVKQDEEKDVEQKKSEYRTVDIQPAKRPGRTAKKG